MKKIRHLSYAATGVLLFMLLFQFIKGQATAEPGDEPPGSYRILLPLVLAQLDGSGNAPITPLPTNTTMAPQTPPTLPPTETPPGYPPGVSPTPTPTTLPATATATPTAPPSPTPTAGPSTTPAPTSPPTGGPPLTQTPAPSNTPLPTATPWPLPTNTPLPSPTSASTPEPTATSGPPDTVPLPLEVYTTIESAGIVSPYQGDDNQNGLAVAYYRPVGTTAWLQAHAMMADAAAGEWRVSLVYLLPDTTYEIEVRYQDPDGVWPQVVATTARTRPEYPNVGGSGVVRTVPDDDTLQAAIEAAQPGDTIQLLAGVYRGEFKWKSNDSGAAGQYITIEPAAGASVIFDGSDPDVNGPGDEWAYYANHAEGGIYYQDLPWGDTACGGATMLPNYVGELREGDGWRYLLFDSGSQDWTNDFLAAPAGKAYYVCSGDGPGPEGRLYVTTYDGDDPDNHEMYVGRYRRALRLEGADYIRIRNLEFRYYSLAGIIVTGTGLANSDYTFIEGNTFHAIGEWGIRLEGVSGSESMRDNSIQNNTFYDLGYRDSGWQWDTYYKYGRGDTSSVSLTDAGHGTVIRDNTFESGSDGVNANSHSHDVDVYGNTFNECMDNGIEVDDNAGQNIRVWRNTIYYCFAPMSIQDWNEEHHGPVYIFRNVIIGGDDPLGRKDYLGGDRGYDTTQAFKLGGDAYPDGRAYLYHNTISIIRSTLGEGHGLNDAGGTHVANLVARNNIWNLTGRVYDLDLNTAVLNHDFACNNLHDLDPSNNAMIRWTPVGGPNNDGRYRQLLDFQTYTNLEAGSLSNAGTVFGLGMQLLGGSPEIDAGCVIMGFNDRGAGLYSGSAPDMGAFEYSTS